MRLAWKALVVCLISGFITGCSSPLSELRSELRESGWELWYPAEAGIEPGEIWVISDGRRDLLARRPEGLPLGPDRPVQFRSLQTSMDLTTTLEGGGSLGHLARASASGKLLAKHAKRVELDFGQTTVQRVAIGDFTERASHLPATYRARLASVEDDGDLRVLTSIVQCAGLRYRVVADQSFDAHAAAKALGDDLQIGVTATQVSSDTYVFETPKDTSLVIGVGVLTAAALLTDSKDAPVNGGSRKGSPILLSTVVVRSRKELQRALFQHNDSHVVRLSVPPNAKRLRFRVRDANSLSPQFDVSESGLSDDYYGQGLRSGDTINIADWAGKEFDFQIANVCGGPEGMIKIDVYAE